MTPLLITPFALGQRFIGTTEIAGSAANNPLIQWWISLCGAAPTTPDETAWCSAFTNGICWALRLPRSKSLAARSWLTVGQAIALDQAEVGFDVVVLKRGEGNQPTAEVLDAPGHVGFYAGREGASVLILGGNQNNSVSVMKFPATRILGIRRLQ